MGSISEANSWRRRSATVIRPIVEANPDLDPAALKKLISAAYPFGERAYFPYKAWLAEVKHQLKYAGRRPAGPAPQFGLFA